MRECIRCKSEMMENLELITNDGMGIAVKERGAFKRALGKIKCAVCRECGYTELYVENTDKIK